MDKIIAYLQAIYSNGLSYHPSSKCSCEHLEKSPNPSPNEIPELSLYNKNVQLMFLFVVIIAVGWCACRHPTFTTLPQTAKHLHMYCHEHNKCVVCHLDLFSVWWWGLSSLNQCIDQMNVDLEKKCPSIHWLLKIGWSYCQNFTSFYYLRWIQQKKLN